MVFSVLVELLNMRARKAQQRRKAAGIGGGQAAH
jgi:hypothetical protein